LDGDVILALHRKGSFGETSLASEPDPSLW